VGTAALCRPVGRSPTAPLSRSEICDPNFSLIILRPATISPCASDFSSH
jgi:hypothetical protein